MNNDRAGSFLCSFQTFQTFMSSVLRAYVHVLPATRNICPVVCSQTYSTYMTWYST